MDRRDFLKLSGLALLSFFLPNIQIGEGMTTYTEMMMNVINNEPLSAIDKEQLRVMFQEMDSNRQIVSAWQNVDKKVNSSFINFPISVIYSEVLSETTPYINVGISNLYKNILFLGSGRSDAAFDGVTVRIQFNDDTGNNYDTNGSGVSNNTATKNQDFDEDSIEIGNIPGSTGTTNASGFIFAVLPNFNSSFWKSAMAVRGNYNNAQMISYTSYGTWENTDTVKSIKVYPSQSGSFVAGTSISIYGLV